MPIVKFLSQSTLGEPVVVTSTTSGTPDKLHDFTDSKAARISLSARNLHSSSIDLYIRVKDGSTTGAYTKYTLDPLDTQKKEEFVWIDKIAGEGTGVDLEAYVSNATGCHVYATIIEED